MRRRTVGMLIFLTYLLGSGIVCGWAQSAMPKPFMRMGKIGGMSADTVLIEDTRYALSTTVQVYAYDPATKDRTELREKARVYTLSMLREGMEVGYIVVGEGAGKRGIVTEIWVLPAGSMRILQRQD